MKNSISIENGKVTSYETHVANIVGNELQVFVKCIAPSHIGLSYLINIFKPITILNAST